MNAIERLNDTELANVNGGTTTSFFAMDILMSPTEMIIKAHRKLTDLRVFYMDPHHGERNVLTWSLLPGGYTLNCPPPSNGQHYYITCVADGIEQRYEI